MTGLRINFIVTLSREFMLQSFNIKTFPQEFFLSGALVKSSLRRSFLLTMFIEHLLDPGSSLPSFPLANRHFKDHDVGNSFIFNSLSGSVAPLPSTQRCMVGLHFLNFQCNSCCSTSSGKYNMAFCICMQPHLLHVHFQTIHST